MSDGIYEQMKATGVEIGNHYSDLYVPVTEETTAIVKDYEFKTNVTRFTNQIDHKPWYDIPFAFTPYWDERRASGERFASAINKGVRKS